MAVYTEKSSTGSSRRNTNHSIESLSGGNIEVVELNQQTTRRGLKSRHAQMIALGGTIGTALFVGSGQGLHIGGPLFLFLSYILIATMLYGVATATGEMSAYLPISGASIAYYGHRFVSHSLGFALGWMYWYTFAVTCAAEITAATLVIDYWDNPVPTAVWITIIGAVIILLNCLPVRFYGETEFWFASTKVIGILSLIMLTVVLFSAGDPRRSRSGFVTGVILGRSTNIWSAAPLADWLPSLARSLFPSSPSPLLQSSSSSPAARWTHRGGPSRSRLDDTSIDSSCSTCLARSA